MSQKVRYQSIQVARKFSFESPNISSKFTHVKYRHVMMLLPNLQQSLTKYPDIVFLIMKSIVVTLKDLNICFSIEKVKIDSILLL